MTPDLPMPKPAPPDRIRRLKVVTYDGFNQSIVLPPWGYLEGVELRTRELLPNMDASNPYRFDVHLGLHFDPGASIPFDVFAVVRDVVDLGAGPDPYSPPPLPGESSIECPHCGSLLKLHTDASVVRS